MNPRFWLAGHNLTPVEAAPKKDTPVEVLRWLAESPDEEVVEKLAGNPSIPPDVAWFLANQRPKNELMMRNLVGNSRVPISLIRQIHKGYPWPEDIRDGISRRLGLLDFMSQWRGFAAAIVEVIALKPHNCTGPPDPHECYAPDGVLDQPLVDEEQSNIQRNMTRDAKRLGELDPREPEQYPEAEQLVRKIGNHIRSLKDIGCEMNLDERAIESRLKLWKRHSATVFTHDNPNAALPPPEALRSKMEALKITHRDYHTALGKEINVRNIQLGTEELAVMADAPPLKVKVLPTIPDWLKGIKPSEDFFEPWWNILTTEPITLTDSRGEERNLTSGVTLATTFRPKVYFLTFGLGDLYLHSDWVDNILADAEQFEAADES